MKHLKGKERRQCADWWERRSKGKRYVNSRGQCTRETWHPSGYCKAHRYPWRWSEADEALARASLIEEPAPAKKRKAKRGKS